MKFGLAGLVILRTMSDPDGSSIK